jgi:predicted AAA+ superfamily ATPase
MFQRTAIEDLRKWRESSDRKPLILRGARQVGKTTLVKEFAKEYDVFLHLNLENKKDRKLFEDNHDIHELIDAIFYHKDKYKTGESVLLFIDEIQFSKPAVAILRYFYEEANYIHVIVAGSLLETVIDVRKISFPVGRVQYMAIRPCSFLEFLNGIGEQFKANAVKNFKAHYVHEQMMKLFNDYVLVGGMPATIAKFAENRDILAVKNIYDSLLVSYQDDVEKYASNNTLVKTIRMILTVGWQNAGETITFERFGGISSPSKEISEAFQTIQKAMLLELVYPTSEAQMPLRQNFRKHPKLIWLDTGLVNYFAGIQREVFSVKDITDVWRGRIAEHIVAQELLTLDDSLLTKRYFWRRDRHGSDAEVDFIHAFDSMAIPIEVKSGHNAKLKSLHLFMDEAPHAIAVRVWSQPFSVNEVTTQKGKKFKLLNVPFYYVGILEEILKQYAEQA